MKTVITSSGNQFISAIDPRFGRAEWFCIYDNKSKDTSFIKNENIDANSGAGTKAVELMAELNISKVISGRFGPKAKTLLDQLKIEAISYEEECTIGEVIEKIKENSI